MMGPRGLRPLPDIDDALDRAALERVRTDPGAFSDIVGRYAPVLYSLAYRMLGARRDAAEEAVQDILLKVYRSLDSFDARRRFFPWLYTIGLNHLRSLARSRRSRTRTISLDAAPGAGARSPAPGPDELSVRREGERLAQRALDALPRRHREAYLLRQVEGLSTADAAAVLGVPEATVRTWVFRAQRQLRKILLDSGWS